MNIKNIDPRPMPLFTSLLPFLVIFYEIGVFLSNDAYLPALPSLGRSFGITTEHAQLTISAWFAGSSATQLFIGPLSDRYGRKPILMFGTLLFCVSSTLCALTSHLEIFFIARFLQGVCVAPVFVAGYAAIHESYSSKKAVQILAVVASITLLAPALGPLFGAVIVQFLHWRWILGILAIWGAITFILSFFIKETIKEPCRMSLPSIMKSYGRILSNRLFMSYQMLFAILLGGFFMWLTDSPLILIERAGWGEISFGIAQAIIFFGYIVGNQWTKSTIETTPIRLIMKRGMIFVMLGTFFMMLSYMVGGDVYYYGAVASMVMLSLGAASLSAPLNRLAIDASEESTGKKTAIFSFGISAVAGVSSFLIGIISVGLPWFLLVNSVIAFLIFFSLPQDIFLKEDEENVPA